MATTWGWALVGVPEAPVWLCVSLAGPASSRATVSSVIAESWPHKLLREAGATSRGLMVSEEGLRLVKFIISLD